MYFARRSLTANWHKFWVTCRLVDIINYAKFYRNRLWGLVSEVSKFDHPIGLRCRR